MGSEAAARSESAAGAAQSAVNGKIEVSAAGGSGGEMDQCVPGFRGGMGKGGFSRWCPFDQQSLAKLQHWLETGKHCRAEMASAPDVILGEKQQ